MIESTSSTFKLPSGVAYPTWVPHPRIQILKPALDGSADQLRMTLKYEGIFGGKKGSFLRDEKGEPHDPKKLNTQQKEQMESVLKGGRAFFFLSLIHI